MMLLTLAVEPCTVAVTLTWSPDLDGAEAAASGVHRVEPVTW